MGAARGGWADGVNAVNSLLDDLLGALSQRMDLDLRVDQLLGHSQTLVKELRAQQESLVKLSQRVLTAPSSLPAASPIRFPAPSRTGGGQTRNQANARKALVVVDDEAARFRIVSTLSQRGFQSLVAETGKDGLELLLANTDAALVLIDVDTPRIEGVDTIHIIRGLKEFQQLPIIAMGRERGGASDQLPKPVNPEQLAALLQAWTS
jgi:CheY-like chemotaxis protein